MLRTMSNPNNNPYITPTNKAPSAGAGASKLSQIPGFVADAAPAVERTVPMKTNYSPVQESVMVERESHELDDQEADRRNIIYCDIPTAEINDDVNIFVKQMARKAVRIRPIFFCLPSRESTPFAAQGGVVLLNGIDDYQLVTARHNINSNHKKRLEIFNVEVQLWSTEHHKTKLTPVSDGFGTFMCDINHTLRLPLRNGSWWQSWDVDSCRCAFDTATKSNCLAKAKILPKTRILQRFDPTTMAFEKISSNFQLRKGMKVAIVVDSYGLLTTATPANANSAETSYTADELYDIYGPPGGVSLYSGEITHVGVDHIEHNINTYKGCSGAIVFLLDGEHRGKAIAVHVGYEKNKLKTNIGLNIIKGVKKSWTVRFHQLCGIFQLPQSKDSGGTTDRAVRDLRELKDCEARGTMDSSSDDATDTFSIGSFN